MLGASSAFSALMPSRANWPGENRKPAGRVVRKENRWSVQRWTHVTSTSWVLSDKRSTLQEVSLVLHVNPVVGIAG